MDTFKKAGVPKILPVLIVVILAAMYYVAAYYPDLGKTNNPEKTVEDFYVSYINSDYQGMAENLSVFWSVQFLPQYSTSKPSEVIAQRETIEKETADILSATTTDIQSGLKITVLPEYTKEWENTAMVVYSGSLDEEELGREVALLLKENQKFYLYMWMPCGDDAALTALETDFAKFDADYTQVLASDQW
ncbi:MAG TPA: hypothetical protein PKN87_01390 [Syntrophomonadaceae bacterium]|nr:hypothetical protein [Syntrophomonadaceae bacterium]HPR93366.1 hypothetical protein [Syntrophomonadaceae bacterium]